tara:strand:- start:2081 stop:2884 length:804 start_codon:yes stop_codon:yes gene_type:complete
MNKFLVIGNPIGHSLSPLIHNYWFKKYRFLNHVYEKKEVDEKDLEKIVDEVRKNELKGVNVTVPFKQKIIPYLDGLDYSAEKTQSVNTLLKKNNRIVGFNTDSIGFSATISEKYGFEITDDYKFFVIGAGGVTSSIINGIGEANKIYVTNRTKHRTDELKKKFPQIEIVNWGTKPPICDIVINTTSVGLTKDENLEIDFTNYLNNDHALFYDLIYNPKETNFLKDAKSRGNKIMNGQMMFLHQAKVSFQLWTDVNPEINDEVIKLLD